MPLRSNAAVTVWPLTGLSRQLGYRVPSSLAGRIQPGSLVRVPLLNRTVLGVVDSMETPVDCPAAKLKYIHDLPQPFPVVTPDMLKLAEWMTAYYGCTLESVLELMIPGAVRKGMQAKMISTIVLKRKLDHGELEQMDKRAPRQAQLYRFLDSQLVANALPKASILSRLGMSAGVCDGLVEKGIVEIVQVAEDRRAYEDELAGAERITAEVFDLNPDQQAVFDKIASSLNRDTFSVHLLHGVTGSGKTEVYISAVLDVLSNGGGVIFLVPEVALAPQTVARLRSRLESMAGVESVVWHSHLSEGERYDAWAAVASGKARVVVGARSAVFAPVRNLKLIVVDEEHEPAFKQDETPRYHGRDVAVYRARLCQATCILGSATPSLESVHNARRGKYHLVQLHNRVDDRQLPLVHLVDMKREVVSSKGPVTFSRMLAEKMRERYESREQTILFINRRGYSTSMLCPDCGHVAMCDHCSITMTFHRKINVLRCHLCGDEIKAPERCPQCRSPKIRWRGFGTQKVEDVAQAIVKGAKIVRLDADTMYKKNLFREILADFRRGKIDILVGTQMIAKGLDFPNVTLVGLLDADISLHIQDFRAHERTFQLLTQVAGRAGRGDRAGEVVVQTFLPFSSPIQFARKQDFDGFCEEELESRREARYPPYVHIVRHIWRGKNPDKIEFFAEQWARKAEQELETLVSAVRGPSPAPVEKIKDNYRFHIWYFTDSITRLMPKLVDLRSRFQTDKDIMDVFDVDPLQMM